MSVAAATLPAAPGSAPAPADGPADGPAGSGGGAEPALAALARLASLDSAEAFFALLKVAYDPARLAARRLPVLATYRRLMSTATPDPFDAGGDPARAAALIAHHAHCLADAYATCCAAPGDTGLGGRHLRAGKSRAFVSLAAIAGLPPQT